MVCKRLEVFEEHKGVPLRPMLTRKQERCLILSLSIGLGQRERVYWITFCEVIVINLIRRIIRSDKSVY